MNKLKDFLNALPVIEQREFAIKCGTTIGYLRKRLSDRKHKLGEHICILIEGNTEGKIVCEELRPDINWSILRKKLN